MARKYVNGEWIEDESKVAGTSTDGTGDQRQNNDWYGQMQQLMGQINNRQPFEYNIDKDALYQQYKDQYTRLGQQAMKDTMGQAAGLTGGYGSSYAQNVGQQAYDDYLTKLNAEIPGLYAQARAGYDADTDDLYQRFNLALGMYNQEQDDAYRDWQKAGADQDRANDQAYREWQMRMAELERQDSLDQASRSNAREYALMLLQMGISPSDEQLASAGISAQEAAGIRNYYLQQQYAAGSGGGSSGGGGGGSRRSSGGGGNKGGGGQPTLSAIPEARLVSYARQVAANGGKLDAVWDALERSYGGDQWDLEAAYNWINQHWRDYVSKGGRGNGNGAGSSLDLRQNRISLT